MIQTRRKATRAEARPRLARNPLKFLATSKHGCFRMVASVLTSRNGERVQVAGAGPELALESRKADPAGPNRAMPPPQECLA